ncbi:LPS assembly lipoprotein LptE [Shewanella insulae]|uniref:LPS-assembly lipoprotein LptE n=1 Tax=Shewanella insulae TaxID=2681496 RepID=UPI001EFC9660|nr:LPS assembly lipoprotein LptE [Shewanella insulae]MCG9711910.1 LPS assembly lipoprotein LptE [Shewanella insulae]MCG9740191.1 LPS assembly lipoprotein LptE [Shewanella insulae]MCG9756273.1 LPS assembly lipoprotein LptE [Shewanella insulae]
MLIKRLCFAILTLSVLLSAGCGFKLQRSYSIPDSLKTLTLSSQDEYSELTRLVRERLRLNSITVVEDDASVPAVRILNDSLDRSTLSLYPTGNVAEYELNYHVRFAVQYPEREAKAFEVDIHRDYLDDPRTALAKSREMELLVKEMRIQAADSIIQILASIETN